MDLTTEIQSIGDELLESLSDHRVWLGTTASYDALVKAAERLAVISAEDAKAFGAARAEDDDRPSLLQVFGSVGVIPIQGSLLKRGNWLTRMFGMTDYETLRATLAEAASKPEVKKILLCIDSPGGHVAGLQETADLIRNIDKKIKPVYAHASGQIASAAYWLGCSARQVDVSKATMVGSIGVVMVHMERSKMLAEAGIAVKVIRAGKYKQLANEFEPLSKEGEKILQAQVDDMYKEFVTHVAACRGVTYAKCDDTMAQGRVFLSDKAVDVGLADRVRSYDEVMAILMKDENAVDISRNFNKNRSYTPKGVTGMLNETILAKLASGAELTAEEQALADAERAAQADAEKKAAEEAAAKAEQEAAAKATADQEAAAKAEEAKKQAPADTPASVQTFLQEQIKAKDAELVDLKVELKQLKAQADSHAVTFGPMQEIVRTSINKMRVALGGSASDLSSLDPVKLLEEHKAVAEQFAKTFKVGGVASVAPEEKETKTEAAAVSPRTKAQITAVRFGKK